MVCVKLALALKKKTKQSANLSDRATKGQCGAPRVFQLKKHALSDKALIKPLYLNYYQLTKTNIISQYWSKVLVC